MAKIFTETDISLNRTKEEFLVSIISTKGCFWAKNASGCYMCGYSIDSNPNITENDIIKQIDIIKSQIVSQKPYGIKIYNSGSFFDKNDFPERCQEYILDIIANTDIEEVIIESCPNFITDKNISKIKNKLPGKSLIISLGLESSSNRVLKYSINKPTQFEDYIRASEIIKKNKCHIKTYLLYKPPFLSEKEAYLDLVNSLKKIKDYTTITTINLCNIQKNTLLEKLYMKKEYKTGWLWSVVKAIYDSRKFIDNYILIVGLAGAATKRGVHNCKKCSKDIVRLLKNFSLTQDFSLIESALNISCSCKKAWETESCLKIEG